MLLLALPNHMCTRPCNNICHPWPVNGLRTDDNDNRDAILGASLVVRLVRSLYDRIAGSVADVSRCPDMHIRSDRAASAFLGPEM